MIELYHNAMSTCSQKVRLVLAEKGLAWTSRELDLRKSEHLAPDYLRLNPDGVVPTLVVDGAVVRESTVIVEYLDDAFPDPPLAPSDPLGKALLWIRACIQNLVHSRGIPGPFDLTSLHRPLPVLQREVVRHLEEPALEIRRRPAQ